MSCGRTLTEEIMQKILCFVMHYLLLLLLKSCKGHIQIFINLHLPEELYSSLKHLPPVSNVAVLFLKVCILDPVLDHWMYNNKCTGVKEFKTNWIRC